MAEQKQHPVPVGMVDVEWDEFPIGNLTGGNVPPAMEAGPADTEVRNHPKQCYGQHCCAGPAHGVLDGMIAGTPHERPSYVAGLVAGHMNR
jgi:hypothetical protein